MSEKPDGPNRGRIGIRLGYLGPEGTFSEAALRRYSPDHEAIPYLDVLSALEAVRSGAIDAAVVPIENSVEGGVNATLDALAAGDPLMIVGEVLLPITFTVARSHNFHGEIRRIGTHPHAWAQCRKWVHQNLPAAAHVPTPSTAAAAAALAEGSEEFDAVLCSAISAEKYQLHTVAADVADNRNAVTRFVAVARPSRLPEPTGADKTTLMVHLAHNEAGGLLDMLEQFAVRGVNLSRIESRPIGDSLGRYSFSMDAEGHVAEQRVQAVLIGLHRVCPVVQFMGSYPAADGRRPIVRNGTADEDFVAARAWVGSILEQDGDPIPIAPPAYVPIVNSSGPAMQLGNTDSKTRILNAALHEFYRFGYDGASMRRIASNARSDPGLIPYHFGRRRALFESAVFGELPSLEDALALFTPAPDLTVPGVGAILEMNGGTGIRAAVVGFLRTAIAPSPSPDAIQAEMAAALARVAQKSAERVENPHIAHPMLRLTVGLLVLRDIAPVAPLAHLGTWEVVRLVEARLKLVDPDLQAEPIPHRERPARAAESGWGPQGLPDPGLPARERILAAATMLFAKWGCHRASLREIAQLADCDIALVHYYFGGKTGVLEAVLDQCHLREPAGTGEGEIADRLDEVFACMQDPETRTFLRVLLTTGANPGNDAIMGVVLRRLQGVVDSLFGGMERSDIAIGFHLLFAELVGSLVMDEILEPSEGNMICPQTHEFARRLVAGANSGMSLEQLAQQE